MGVIMNELYLENGFKVHITLQVSKTQSPGFASNRACALFSVIRKSTMHYSFNGYMFFIPILNPENTDFADTDTTMKCSTDSITQQQQNLKENIISRNNGHPEPWLPWKQLQGPSDPTLAAAAEPAKPTSAPVKAGRVSYIHAFPFKWIRKLQNIFI